MSIPAKVNNTTGDVLTAANVNNLGTAINMLALSTLVVSAVGTTTLTVASNRKQTITGSTTQTFVLPVVSTLSVGDTFEILNKSSGIVTVQSSGANTVLAMAGDSRAVFTCVLITGTTAASWATPVVVSGGGVLLSTTTVAELTTTITSINQAYKRLRIKIYGIGCGNAHPTVAVTFNSSSIFQGLRITGNITTFSSASLSASGLTSALSYNGNSATQQRSFLLIEDYAQTVQPKPLQYYENFQTSDPGQVGQFYSGKLVTAAAIESLTLTLGSGSSGFTGTIEIWGEN